MIQGLSKIGSLAAEIFLIWTKVARTNVTRTNIRVIFGFCSRCSKDPMFKVWSKSGQKQLRYCCLRVCVVGGWWWWVLVCKPILGQAEQKILVQKFRVSKNKCPSLVKFALVLSEIFHYADTRTNVAGTNVSRTNVPKTFANSHR